ncbi:protein of unknown function [Ruminococcaceae bacterium BL-6]|nr:protein of unknown function [Ruminococcaceae bacterium BL-6]
MYPIGNTHCIPYEVLFWRKRWDSNPRDLAVYLISSQARYDHFDTLPFSAIIPIPSRLPTPKKGIRAANGASRLIHAYLFYRKQAEKSSLLLTCPHKQR